MSDDPTKPNPCLKGAPLDCTNSCMDGPCDCSGEFRVLCHEFARGERAAEERIIGIIEREIRNHGMDHDQRVRLLVEIRRGSMRSEIVCTADHTERRGTCRYCVEYMDGERAATERIVKAKSEIVELAREAQAEWSEHEPFTPLAEYERGYMNAMHQALDIIERGEHKEATHE